MRICEDCFAMVEVFLYERFKHRFEDRNDKCAICGKIKMGYYVMSREEFDIESILHVLFFHSKK